MKIEPLARREGRESPKGSRLSHLRPFLTWDYFFFFFVFFFFFFRAIFFPWDAASAHQHGGFLTGPGGRSAREGERICAFRYLTASSWKT